MSHYEERLESDLRAIQEAVGRITADVERALERATACVLKGDPDRAHRTVLGDLPINRATRAVERRCHLFIARHLPTAGVLRSISSVLRLMVALERIGDYAVTIARESIQLAQPPPQTVARDIEMMADHSLRLLREATGAFDEKDSQRARGAMALSGQGRSMFRKVYDDLVGVGESGERSVRDLFALLAVVNRLERVGDLAKNICEETIFAATGETKSPKRYSILFIDETGAVAGPLARAMADKAFPESGAYRSAARRPGGAIDPIVVEFMNQRGLDPSGPPPVAIDDATIDLLEMHVVVDLEPIAGGPGFEVPFHTVYLRSPVGPSPRPAPWTDADIERLHGDLSIAIRDLMELMRGEDAA